MPSNRRWSVSDGRKLATGILVVVAVFILSASIGAMEWELAAVGVALLAAGAAIYVVSAMNSRTFVYVPGTALVRSSSPPPATALQGRCEMQVLVRAPGMDDVAVRIRDAAVPVSKWPDAGARLPILVASGDPRRVRVLWDNVRTNRDATGGLADVNADETYGDEEYAEESFDGETYDIFDELGSDLTGDDGANTKDGEQSEDSATVLYGNSGDTDTNVVELVLMDPSGVLREPESPARSGDRDTEDPAGTAAAEPDEGGSAAEVGSAPVTPTPRPRPRPRPSPSPRPSPRPRRPVDAPLPPMPSGPAPTGPATLPPMMPPSAAPGTAAPGATAPPLTSGPAARASAGAGTPGPSASGSSAPGIAMPHAQMSRSTGHGRRDRPAIRIQHMLPALPAVPAIPDPAPPANEPIQDAAGEISDAYLAITGLPGQDPTSEQAHGVDVALAVSNLGRSVAFYRDVLGFQQVDIGPGSAVLESGGGRVVLQRELDMEAVDPRLVYLLLEVPDVQAAYEDLHARGVEFVHRPRAVSRYEQLELWSAAFRDPDGHGIALTRWDIRK